jgi:hypothetical protein
MNNLMNPLPHDHLEVLAHRLSTIDAEIRSIRATLFHLTQTQQKADGAEAVPLRTAEDFVQHPD